MVKIYTIAAMLLLGTAAANAQFTTGQKVLGGNLSFTTNKTAYPFNSPYTTRFTSVVVSPSFSSFIKPNLLQGVALSYSSSCQTNKSATNELLSKQSTNAVGLSFFRQRFFTLAPKFYFTLNGSIGGSYTFGNQTNYNNGTTSKNKNNGYSAGIGLTPGLSYQLTNRLLFDANFSNVVSAIFTHSKATSGGMDAKSNGFSLSSSLSNSTVGNLGLGFRLLLKK